MTDIQKEQNDAYSEQPNRKFGPLNAGKKFSGNPQNERDFGKGGPDDFIESSDGVGFALIWAFLGGFLTGAWVMACIFLILHHE
jgi:hypothetical protein